MGRVVSKSGQIIKADTLIACSNERQQDVYGAIVALEIFANDTMLSGEAYSNAKGYVHSVLLQMQKALCIALEDEISANQKVVACCEIHLAGVDRIIEDDLMEEINRRKKEIRELQDDWWDFLPIVREINQMRIAYNYLRINYVSEQLRKLEAYDNATQGIHEAASARVEMLTKNVNSALSSMSFSNNRFNYADVDMGWVKPFIRRWNSFSRLEEIKCNYFFEIVMEKSYGFSPEQADLFRKAYLLVKEEYGSELSNVELANEYWGIIASLCFNYDATRWRMTANIDSRKDAMSKLKKLGMTDQDILDLIVTINCQHGHATEEEFKKQGVDFFASKYSNKSFKDYWNASEEHHKDFAHEAIQLAIFSNEITADDITFQSMVEAVFTQKGPYSRGIVDIINSSKGTGKIYTNYEGSFKGDIDSLRYDPGDFASDLDAINVYDSISRDGKDPFTAFISYNSDVHNGEKNRAVEFLNALGNGDEGAGWVELIDVLGAETAGSEHIRDGKDITKGTADFVEFLQNEYKNGTGD